MSLLDPTSLLQGLGPWALVAVAIMVFIESGVLFPFLPGDSLLFTAGLLSLQLGIPLPVLIIVVSLAAIAGDQVGYLLGRRFGRRWFKDDAKILKTAYLERTEEFYARRGGAAVILSRFVPIVRTYAPLAAGAARYQYRSFTLWNIVGAVAWATSVTLLGSWLGQVQFIAKNIDVIAVAIVVISVVPSVVGALLRRRKAAGPARDAADSEVLVEE
ncbi:DedA family protein [Psychromicrobium xiongbiense]|uniref:DedA family protein n=1 Tax=Psychromicrobium xiongbiense TaxID=3051184 RepID=UPI00255737C5|nr:VTT domain-containing protein [Psychromicrobium sp. YIM S02556]